MIKFQFISENDAEQLSRLSALRLNRRGGDNQEKLCVASFVAKHIEIIPAIQSDPQISSGSIPHGEVPMAEEVIIIEDEYDPQSITSGAPSSYSHEVITAIR